MMIVNKRRYDRGGKFSQLRMTAYITIFRILYFY